jgi:predicted transcriptional regulator
MEKEKSAVIYPVSYDILKSLKDFPKSFIFVKFTIHQILPKFKEKANLFIYESHNQGKIIGRGNIISTELLTEDEILNKHSSELLIPRKVLRDYVGDRKEKRLLTIGVSNFKLFDKPIFSPFKITMVGRFLYGGECDLLFKL